MKIIGTIGGIIVLFIVLVFVIAIPRERKVIEAQQQLLLAGKHLTALQGAHWVDVKKEVVTVVRTQDFLSKGNYSGEPYFYHLVECSNGTVFFQTLGGVRAVNDRIDALDTSGSRVGESWELTFGKKVDADYSIRDTEMLIDTKPLATEGR